MVRSVCQDIMASSEGLPTLTQLAAKVGVSPYYLHRLFKRVTGITPRQYADTCRLGALKTNLKNGRTIADALYEAGYGSSSRLYGQSSAQLGMTPAAYRRGGQGLQVYYVIVGSPLGFLLVAATERGVCSAKIGDDEASLEEALGREYAASKIRREDTRLGEWVEVILRHLSGRLPHLDLPLDVQATAFERLVWEQLQRIPYGETRCYQEIAAALGRPTSARAVGRACGANPVALLIPCHRVVRKDGDAGGYRWGIARKEALLDRERTFLKSDAM
jgi:AraC family transcriptional regulator of adaptative response/methylated-DNA-[protein]-cysteine methyltransferase